jgi:predicted RNA methylase
MHPLARAIVDGQRVDDDAFDALLSIRSQVCSRSFWSPVAAARRAAELFRDAGAQRVLDVGAGAGKFCVVASLVLGHRVWGIERRDSLVREGEAIATALGADIELTHGTLVDVDPTRFDGFYFFNPFGEYVADEEDRYDTNFPRSFDGYVRDARRVERWLRAAPVGTVVVTNHGLGGRIPASFTVKHTERSGRGVMRLWVKEREDVDDAAWFEVEDELVDAKELLELAKSPDDEPLVAALCAPADPSPED